MKTPEQIAEERNDEKIKAAKKYAKQYEGLMYTIGSIAGVSGIQMAFERGVAFGLHQALEITVERESAERAAEQHWISVKERLPPDGAKVLLIVFGDIHYGWIDQSPSDPTEYCLYFSNTYIDKGHHALTHWMPIPSKPKYMSDYVEHEPPKEEK